MRRRLVGESTGLAVRRHGESPPGEGDAAGGENRGHHERTTLWQADRLVKGFLWQSGPAGAPRRALLHAGPNDDVVLPGVTAPRFVDAESLAIGLAGTQTRRAPKDLDGGSAVYR